MIVTRKMNIFHLILFIYVKQNNEINSLILFVLDLLKRGECAHSVGRGGMSRGGTV
jgi:hypothetical protein